MDNLHQETTQQRITRRGLAVLASVTVNAVLSAALLAMFDSSASLPWLAPTEANQALISRCAPVKGSAEHRACVTRVVAAVRARDASVQVATQR